MNKRLLLLVAGLIVCTIIAVLAVRELEKEHITRAPFVNKSLLKTLPHYDKSGIDTSHLADGITPPTNTWFSGIALQQEPKIVFPTPLSFQTTDNSFSTGLPVLSTTANTIFNTLPHQSSFAISDASHYRITRYDEVSVDVTYYRNSTALGTATLAAGSPYIFFIANSDTTLTLRSSDAITSPSTSILYLKNQAASSVVAVFDGARMTGSNSTTIIDMPKGSLMTFYALPVLSLNDGDPLLATAGNRLTAVTMTYRKQDSTQVTTAALTTANNQPTVFTLLPHQQSSQKQTRLYQTLYGPQQLIYGNRIDFATPHIPVVDSLSLNNISASDRALLTTSLRRDINATQLSGEDTYSSGKQLYRAAQLLDLAEQLGETGSVNTIKTKLKKELTVWFSPADSRQKKYFYYDEKIQGIVGQTPSFGSQEFNDHHFHYGYIIYAAALLAKYDKKFLAEYDSMVNLLVADIANYKNDESLPLRRSFDPYFGHSWASGSAPFNAGNNQESSSEAINAWVAVSLWATQTANETLQSQAAWMLSNEVAATSQYWTNFDTTQLPYLDGFTRNIISLNWGGKRDYATFFSANPHDILGILLLPMNPSMVYQSASKETIGRQVREALPDGTFDTSFGDYILMYQALGDKNPAYLSIAMQLPDSAIDSANSRSYLYAWIISQK